MNIPSVDPPGETLAIALAKQVLDGQAVESTLLQQVPERWAKAFELTVEAGPNNRKQVLRRQIGSWPDAEEVQQKIAAQRSGTAPGTQAEERIGVQIAARVMAGDDADDTQLAKASERWQAAIAEAIKSAPDDRRDALLAHIKGWPDYASTLTALLAVDTNVELESELKADQADRARYVVTAGELLASDDPTPLIGGHLLAGSLVAMYGEPKKSLKTFAALDLAVSVATATPWFGIAALEITTPGQVVYVAGEGVGGLKARFQALRARRGDGWLSKLHVIKQTVNLLDADSVLKLDVLLEDLTAGGPVQLVVIDTFARALFGADENSSRDVGAAIAALDQIRAKYGCTILLVHHTTKAGHDARGSSALLGAVDTMLRLDGDGLVTTIRCEAQKEMTAFAPIKLRLVPVDGTGSCVLELADWRDRPAGITPRALEVLRVLAEGTVRSEGKSSSAWAKEVAEKTGLGSSQFFELRKSLVEANLVGWVGHKVQSPTDDGYAALGLEPPATTPTPINSDHSDVLRSELRSEQSEQERDSERNYSDYSDDSRSRSNRSSSETPTPAPGRMKGNGLTVERVNAADGVEELP